MSSSADHSVADVRLPHGDASSIQAADHALGLTIDPDVRAASLSAANQQMLEIMRGAATGPPHPDHR